jgi:glycosyltransferase involved in cell wall biosynthesis
MPLISVIIPTRNRASLLREALESVLAVGAAHQDRFGLEILVIDDGSTDETADVVGRYPARLLHTAGAQGASAGRNVGMAAATGDYIAFLDDDDVWLPDNVSAQLAVLEAHPEYGLVFAQAQRTEEDLTPFGDLEPPGPAESGWIFERLLYFWPQVGMMLVRAEVAREVGPFDESLVSLEDWDYILRVAKKWQIGWVETPVILFRQRSVESVSLMRNREPFLDLVFRRHTRDLPLSSRIRLERVLLRHKGWFASQFLNSSFRHDQIGDHEEAKRARWYAFQSSPMHTSWLLLRLHGRNPLAASNE